MAGAALTFGTKIVAGLFNSNAVTNSTQTNMGAHEVSRSAVTEQEEGGVHVLEFHIPTMDSPMAVAVVAIAAVALVLVTFLTLKCVRRCLCPCSGMCARRKKHSDAEAFEMENIIPVPDPTAPEIDADKCVKDNGSPPAYATV